MPTDQRMRFYTTERLGPTRSMTPEGYLLIKDVPLARTGTQVYGPGEVPVEPGPDGRILIDRDPEEVFRPETLASFNLKPFVDDHPSDDVTPENWRSLARGVIHDPRRGEGIQDDLMLGDILITCPQMIDAVKSGRIREVSAGYDADYEQTAPGRGRQFNIVGNHMAGVEQGRCGPRCSIGDRHLTESEQRIMRLALQRSTKVFDGKDGKMARRKGWFDRMMRRAMDAETPEELEKIKEEYKDQMPAEMHEEPDGDEEHQHIHVHLPGAAGGESGGESGGEGDRRTHDDPNEERLAALEALCQHLKSTVEELQQAIAGGDDEGEAVEMENEDTGDKARYIMRRGKDRKSKDEDLPLPDKTPEMMGETDLPGTSAGDRKRVKDSVYLEPVWQDVIAAAEILSPGIRVPTFDAAQHWSTSAKRLCSLRRRALDGACTSDDGRKIVNGVIGGEWKTLGPRLMCDSVTVAFNSAATLMRQRNNDNASGSGHAAVADTNLNVKAGPRTLAELNKINAAAYPGGHRAQ